MFTKLFAITVLQSIHKHEIYEECQTLKALDMA